MSRKCKDPHCTRNRKDNKRGSYVSENRKKPSRKKIRTVNNSHNPSRHRKMRENYNKEFNCGPVNEGFSPCPFVSTSPQNYKKGPSTGTHRVRCSKKSGNHSPQKREREKDSRIWKTKNKNICCSCVDRLKMEKKCICGLMAKEFKNTLPCKCGKTIKKSKENYVLCPSFSFHAHCQCHSHCDKYSDKVRKDHSCESNKSTTSTFHKLCSCFRRKSNSTLSQLSSTQCLCRDCTVGSSEFYKSSEFHNTQNPHETNKKNVLYPLENIHKIECCKCLQEKQDMPNQYKESCCKCIRKKTKICTKPSSESTKITKCKKTKRSKRSRYSSSECKRSIREKGGGSKSFTPAASFACVLKEREEISPLQSSQSNNTNKGSSSLTLEDNQASCFECQQRIHRPEKLSSQIIVSTEETVRRDEKKKKRKNKGSKVQGSRSTLMGVIFDIIFWPYAFWPGRRTRGQFYRTASK
ncbi:uncharacterized protein LOC107275065 isoform X2 [Cephus cinctus]|uniref:Uncharacterized protein LOC107275065 isoform X2 n=1 Tax=Cephus cinctus TaxID=211228 RepID=A0AAJ7VWS1_CEPCN|nr:uncharacterized protein LOC107275065 isoform X2 [Cephus cinctus]